MGRMIETGWLSSVGIELNQCCVECRVWVGHDAKARPVEFDGMPHHCTPAQQVAAAAPQGTEVQTQMGFAPT